MSTGGFTRSLHVAGAASVYSVDAGFGQLLGSLRQDPRVVNLERTNLADARVSEAVGAITLDLSYLSLAEALPQLRIELAADECALTQLHDDAILRVGLPPAHVAQDVRDAVVKWFRRHASVPFRHRVEHYSTHLGIPRPRVFLSPAPTQTGRAHV